MPNHRPSSSPPVVSRRGRPPTNDISSASPRIPSASFSQAENLYPDEDVGNVPTGEMRNEGVGILPVPKFHHPRMHSPPAPPMLDMLESHHGDGDDFGIGSSNGPIAYTAPARPLSGSPSFAFHPEQRDPYHYPTSTYNVSPRCNGGSPAPVYDLPPPPPPVAPSHVPSSHYMNSVSPIPSIAQANIPMGAIQAGFPIQSIPASQALPGQPIFPGFRRSTQPAAQRDTYLSTQKKLRTTICKHWVKGEQCPFGNRCTFAHGPADMIVHEN